MMIRSLLTGRDLPPLLDLTVKLLGSSRMGKRADAESRSLGESSESVLTIENENKNYYHHPEQG
jgi:hypothetical protein